MINLAPIAAAPQPASQTPAPAGNGTGSESTFEAIFDRSVAARRQSAPQNAPDKSVSQKSTVQAQGNSRAEADAQITKAETTENGDGAAPADGTVAGSPDAGTPLQAAPTPGEAEHEPRDRVSQRSVLTDGMAGNGATVYLLNNLNAVIDPTNIAIETSARNGALVSRPEGAASQIMLQDKAAVIDSSEMIESQIMQGKATPVSTSEVAATLVTPGEEAAVGKPDVATTPVMPDRAAVATKVDLTANPVMSGTGAAVVTRTDVTANPVMPSTGAAVVTRTDVTANSVMPGKEVVAARADLAATLVTSGKEAAVGKPDVATTPVMPPARATVATKVDLTANPVMSGTGAAVGRAPAAVTSIMPGKEAVVGRAEGPATQVVPDNTAPVTNATAQFSIQPATLTPTAENPSAQAALSGSITPATGSDLPTPPAAGQHLSARLLDLMSSKEPGAASNTAVPTTGAGLQGPDNVVSGLRISQLSTAPAAQGQQQPAPSDTSPLMASLTQLTSLKEPVSEAPGKSSSSPVHPSGRHAVWEQLLETKIETQRTDDGKQQQQQQQSQQPAKQEIAASPQLFANQTSTSSPSADQSMTFSQISQGVMSQQPAQTAPVTTHQPAMPPAAAPIYEESVFNQVAERLQMQLNNRETQLNIKLHPEELGRLDISLTVKEGSIRAHVVTQSGQVQELLEKNMTRLKALLEGQGFTIEELRVSNRSENIGNSDLFQDQLAGGRTAAAHGSHKTDTSFGETFESVVTTAGSRTTGVNITA